MIELLAYVLAVVFAVKGMYAAMGICIVVGIIINVLGSMKD